MYTKALINNQWKFKKEGEEFTTVNLPHTWNNEDGHTGGSNYYRGVGIYEKELELKLNDNKNYFLEFGAVNSEADVYVNDIHIVNHKGGYSQFRVDFTDVAVEGKNVVTVVANNAHQEEIYPLMADFTFQGGMYRNVNLITVDDVHFDLEDAAGPGVYVSQVDISKEVAKIKVDSNVVNFSTERPKVSVEVTVKDMEGNVVETKTQESLVMDYAIFTETFEIANPTLWDGIKNPYLYTVTSTLRFNDKVIDERVINTGLRYFAFDGDKGFMLNGEQYKLKGVSRHQCRAEVGWAQSPEHQEEDIAIIKELGANSIRLAHYQHDQNFYDLCDKEGFVIWAEIPYISLTSKTQVTGENAMSQMIELVRQNYNHSSIVVWGVQNEITIGQKENNVEEIVTALHELTKKEDPYRLTTQAQLMMVDDNDSMNYVTDSLAFNKYFGWYVGEAEEFDGWLQEFRKVNPNLPVGISEYGAEGILKWHTDNPQPKDYTEEYHALLHEKVMPIFNKYDFVWGTYVWNMFDFASDFRDEGGVQGMNNKGLVTFDRKIKKDAYFYYKSLWSEDPVLHITSKRFEQRENAEIYVKVYTNLDSVELFVNGDSYGTLSPQNCTIKFEGIKLNKGENKVVVKAGDSSDETIFTYVDKSTVDYACPEDATGGVMANWFDSEDLDVQVGEIVINEGYFSVKDAISDVLANEEGYAAFMKYFKEFAENPMFEMAKGMSFETIKGMAGEAVPASLYYLYNEDLNKIKK